MKTVFILGGGTFSYIAPHLALAAPAFGKVADDILEIIEASGDLTYNKDYGFQNIYWKDYDLQLVKTKMANQDYDNDLNIITNEDLTKYVEQNIINNEDCKVVFFSVAMVDFDGNLLDAYQNPLPNGKDQPRLKTEDGFQRLLLTPTNKLITKIRKTRKDIFLVGFKTTSGATPDEQYLTGLKLLKRASCNLVLANDVHTRLNMVITPEQARYHETTDRSEALRGLVEMAHYRSQLQFTRSTIIPGDPVAWNSEMVPDSLRSVVNHCIANNAYKPFMGSTVGHFATKIGEGKFLTSRRKTNFNNLDQVGLVYVESKDSDTVIAHGFSPSVGGQSQRIIFAEHPDVDCIVHFHSHKKTDSLVPVRSQREVECGSHQCGKNTSDGLQRFELPDGQYLYAVMLEKHGPNIVFNRAVDPKHIIKFIDDNFDTYSRTDDVKTELAVQFA